MDLHPNNKSTIDFVKGRINGLKRQRKQLPFEAFDKYQHDKLTRKIRHHENILKAMEERDVIKKGSWKCVESRIHCVCSECGYNGFKHYDYCPWCGADMRESKEEGDEENEMLLP